MNTSVSTRRSATAPLVSRGHDKIGSGAKGRLESISGVNLTAEVGVQRPTNHLGHAHALGFGKRIDQLTLCVREVDLGPGG